MSTALHKRQDSTQGRPGSANVVLYHSDTPVLSVQQGTTFGLTKMLYESIGGHDQIIGLRQRQNSSALTCIITQDQTVLTEREYDILHDSTSPSTGKSSQNPPSPPVEESPLRLQCFYCKKFFACRSTYENHKRTHTGEKPFQCNVCGRCFGNQGNLKQHLHIHRDVKPHVCDICGRGFTRANRLRDHKRAHQYELYMRTNVPWTTTQK